MGICSYCGGSFPMTRATRKYCTPRCKTNACLTRTPRRMRAQQVAAVHGLLDEDFESAEALREKLRSIIAPHRPPVPPPLVPRLD